MLERRRKARFGALGDEHEHELEHPDDVELGMGLNGSDRGLGPQESGVMTLEQEVDNWDENAVDTWDADEGADEYAAPRKEGSKGSATLAPAEGVDGKKRSD